MNGVAEGGEWSLVQLAREAGVTRGVARTAVARGFLPSSGYTESDVVVLKVAAMCLSFPDPSAPMPPKSSPAASKLGRRDADAVRYTRAILGDPRADHGAAVLLGPKEVAAADTAAELPEVLRRLAPHAAVVLPVGMWAGLLPSRRRARAQAQAQAQASRDSSSAPAGPGAAASGARSPVRSPSSGVEPAGGVSARQVVLDYADQLRSGEPW